MMYHFAYLLSMAHALKCSDYEDMVQAYKNNDLNGFVTGRVDGSTYYAPLGYNEGFNDPQVKSGLIFSNADIALMAVSKAEDETCPGAFLYGKTPSIGLYSVGPTKEIPSIVRDVSAKGLKHVDSIVNDKNTEAKVWVKNNSLAISYGNDDETVGLEAALNDYYSSDIAKREDPTGDAWAAINQASGWPGVALAVASFVVALVQLFDSKNTGAKVYSEGSCYYRLDNDHHWQTNDDNCDKSALTKLFENDGDGNCPDVASCLYERETKNNLGSGNWQSTTTIGTDFDGVQQLSCDTYQLQASEYAANSC